MKRLTFFLLIDGAKVKQESINKVNEMLISINNVLILIQNTIFAYKLL